MFWVLYSFQLLISFYFHLEYSTHPVEISSLGLIMPLILVTSCQMVVTSPQMAGQEDYSPYPYPLLVFC